MNRLDGSLSYTNIIITTILSESATMAIELSPLPLPTTADASKFETFGREVKGTE